MAVVNKSVDEIPKLIAKSWRATTLEEIFDLEDTIQMKQRVLQEDRSYIQRFSSLPSSTALS